MFSKVMMLAIENIHHGMLAASYKNELAMINN